jgi:hypothetical protein
MGIGCASRLATGCDWATGSGCASRLAPGVRLGNEQRVCIAVGAGGVPEMVTGCASGGGFLAAAAGSTFVILHTNGVGTHIQLMERLHYDGAVT